MKMNYSSSSKLVRNIMVVAPMVIMSPSLITTRSLSPRISFCRKVPVFDGASRKINCTLPFAFTRTVTMQCVVSMLGSTVLMAALALVPFTYLPHHIFPCIKWNFLFEMKGIFNHNQFAAYGFFRVPRQSVHQRV